MYQKFIQNQAGEGSGTALELKRVNKFARTALDDTSYFSPESTPAA
jgi:hypothetical protein